MKLSGELMSNDKLTSMLVWYGCYFPNHRGKWWVHDRLRKFLRISAAGEHSVMRGGLNWLLDPQDYVQSHLFWLGVRDRWEVFHAKQLVKPGCVMLDIGANFGYYSLLLAQSSKCTVYAFEPNKSTYDHLLRHIKGNVIGERITPFQVGLSDRPGSCDMTEHPGNSGAASVSEKIDGNIKLTTLDTFCNDNGVKPDFIKIDVEGFEERVLSGGLRTLAEDKPSILIELNPPALRLQGSSTGSVIHLLRSQGYRLYQVQRKMLCPLAPILPGTTDYINAFCFHESTIPSVPQLQK